jgi:serine protease Do
MRRSLYIAGALALTTLAAGVLQAQSARARVYSSFDDRDRAAIGITTSSGGMRDTLGLLVQSVTAGGPADKAGLEEGNRIQSVNGVNLRLSAADAGEGDMDGIANRRLIRELEKVKPGDEVELRVWAGGETKTVRVKTVEMEDLPSRNRVSRRDYEDRPTLGLSLSSTGSRRDTLGMLVVRVTTDGPAEKAGIVEGDRVQAINGVSLRVASEDAGDPYMSSARISRYRREISKIAVGEDVELRVYSGGQTKSVRVKPVRVGDLPRDRHGVTIIGDGGWGIGDFFRTPPAAIAPMAPRAPRIFEFDGDLFRDGIRMRLDPRAEAEIREQATEAARRAREAVREAMEGLERLKYDVDRRAEDAETIVAPSPRRARAGSRIASASGRVSSSPTAYAYGYAADANDVAATLEAYAPTAHAVATGGNRVVAAPAMYTPGGSVARWTGDEATFTLQGLRLARVNEDLAEYLGNGSEHGFLVLDAGNRWTGLRAGDVLIEVDGKPVRDDDGARIALDTRDDHTAEVIRDGRRRAVEVRVR